MGGYGLFSCRHPKNAPWGTDREGQPIQPREWQTQAVPKMFDCWRSGKHGVMRAVMGAGKSIAQRKMVSLVLAEIESDPNQKIIVSAPTRKLVRQLGATFSNMFRVGYFYSKKKDIRPQVIVTCNPSLPKLSSVLQKRNFGVSLLMFDEAHRTQNNNCKAIVNAYPDTPRIGVTATPFRRNHKESLAFFDEILFDYGFAEAVRDGVILAPTIVPYTGTERDINAVCMEMIEAQAGVGLANAHNVKDAESFAKYLREHGVAAAAIHSQNGKLHGKLIGRLQSGDLKVLVHVNLMTEGVDLPWLNFLCLRRKKLSNQEDDKGRPKGTKIELEDGTTISVGNSMENLLRFQQEVGRVLRTFPGKTHAFVHDPWDLFNELGMGGFVSIGRSDVSSLEEMEDDEPVEVSEPEEKEEKPALVEAEIPQRTEVSAWLRDCVLYGEFCEFIEPAKRGRWRKEEASQKQIDTVENTMIRAFSAVSGTIDPRSRLMIRQSILAMRRGELNKGDASDLISILFTCTTYKSWMFGTRKDTTA